MSRRRRVRPHPSTCWCRGNGWVCEDHPTQPFSFELPVSCGCEAPGMPCPGKPLSVAPPSDALIADGLAEAVVAA